MSETVDPFHMSGREGMSGYNEVAGMTPGQVFVAGGERTLSEADATLLLATLPRSIPVQVTAALGDAEAFAYAEQMKALLEANGYMVGVITQALWLRPITGVKVITGETPRKIQVGSKPG